MNPLTKALIDQVPGIQWDIVLVWFLIVLTWQMMRRREPGAMARFVAALNSLNQPWVGIIVILQGMVFDVACQKFNISNDAATGVIGAGVGMLTVQGAHAVQQLQQLREQLNQKPPENGGEHPPTPPATPAQPKPPRE